jgi:hypothetical protein
MSLLFSLKWILESLADVSADTRLEWLLVLSRGKFGVALSTASCGCSPPAKEASGRYGIYSGGTAASSNYANFDELSALLLERVKWHCCDVSRPQEKISN